MKRCVSWYGSRASATSFWNVWLRRVKRSCLTPLLWGAFGFAAWVGLGPSWVGADTGSFALDPDTEPPPDVEEKPSTEKGPKAKSSVAKKASPKKKSLWGKNVFMLGAGFSSVEGFLLTSRIATRDLFGVKGLHIGLDANISGISQQTSTQIVYDSPEQPWVLELELKALNQQWQILEEGDNPAWLQVGGSLRVGWKFARGWRVYAGLRLEHHSLTHVENLGPTPGFPELQGARNPRLLSALSLSLEYQTPQDPKSKSPFHKGWDFAFGVEGSSPSIGSSYTFGRVHGHIGYGLSLPYGMHIKVETHAGMLMGNKHSTPFGERYQLGGSGRQLTLLPLLGPVMQQGNMLVPLGGEGMLHAKALFYAPIVKTIGLYAFAGVEAGALLFSQQRPGMEPWQVSWNASFVFGMKWFSPIGPLVFGWGVPMVQHPDMPPGISFSFGIGNAF